MESVSQRAQTPSKSSHDTLVDGYLHPEARLFHESNSTTPQPASEASSALRKTSNESFNSAQSTQYVHDHERDVEKADNAPQPEPETKNQGQNPNLVDWNGPDDPENPQNWPKSKKWLVTLALAFLTLTITFASSVFSAATMVVAKQIGVGSEVGVLGTALFVLGFAFGPIAWGPLSETYGQMTPLFTAFTIFAIFQIPVALAQNIYTIMICRFFAGVFGCAPLVIVGGAFADFWDPVDRGVAVALFAAATFIGPVADLSWAAL